MIWKCLRCGRCCLLHDASGKLRFGMTLLPAEVDRFPKAEVGPLYRDSLGRVLAYQYVGATCLYLKEGGCQEHSARPLTCRAFPLQLPKRGQRLIDLFCSVFGGKQPIEMVVFPLECSLAAALLTEALRKSCEVYDWRKKRWERIAGR